MKRKFPVLLCAATLLPFAPSAFAADTPEEGVHVSNYASFGLGIGFMSDQDLTAGSTGLSSELSKSLDVHAAYGWEFHTSTPFSYRAEAEFGYQRAELDNASSSSTSSTSVGGTSSTAALSANGYVDWHFAKDWAAYGGLGIGVNQADYTLTIPSSSTGLSASKIGYQWQGMLGASYQLAPRYTLFAEYRYQQSLTDIKGSVSGTAFTVDGAKGHHVGVGVRIDL